MYSSGPSTSARRRTPRARPRRRRGQRGRGRGGFDRVLEHFEPAARGDRARERAHVVAARRERVGARGVRAAAAAVAARAPRRRPRRPLLPGRARRARAHTRRAPPARRALAGRERVADRGSAAFLAARADADDHDRRAAVRAARGGVRRPARARRGLDVRMRTSAVTAARRGVRYSPRRPASRGRATAEAPPAATARAARRLRPARTRAREVQRASASGAASALPHTSSGRSPRRLTNGCVVARMTAVWRRQDARHSSSAATRRPRARARARARVRRLRR